MYSECLTHLQASLHLESEVLRLCSVPVRVTKNTHDLPLWDPKWQIIPKVADILVSGILVRNHHEYDLHCTSKGSTGSQTYI
jgi:hypothetical protein